MANLWEMITGLKDRIGNKNPQLTPYQFADNGELDVDRTLQLSMQQPRTPMQHLWGREVGVDVDTTNPEDKTVTTERVVKFQPGFFNDLRSGANENFVTGFAANNLTDNMANGRKKGLAYRLGEGLGSLARLGESPLGRGLLMAGIVGATGGSGLQALAYGAGTGVGNQANRMRDRAYRDDLIRGEQETIMGSEGFDKLDPTTKQMLLNDAANRVNNYRGYITNDVYRNMVDSRIARENAAYRRMYYDNLAKQGAKEAELAQNKLDYEKQQANIKNAQEWARIENDRNKKDTVNFNQITSLRKEFTGLPAIKNANEIKRQFDNVTNTYNAYKTGKLRANAADQAMITTLNKILDPTSVVRESEFARTAAGQSLFARMEGYANKLARGGGGLTNAEREDLYTAMQEMYEANQAEARAYIASYTDLANRYNINPADIMPRQYYVGEAPQQKVYQEGTIIRNKQGKKMIMRDGQWQAI